MVQLIRIELWRTFRLWACIWPFLLMFAFFIQGVETYFDPVFPNFFSAYFYAHGASAGGLFAGIFPLAIPLLTGSSLAWDRKTGFYQAMFIRTTAWKLLGSKFIGTALAAFILVGVTELCAFAYAMVRYPIYDISKSHVRYALELFRHAPFGYILLIVFNAVVAAICFAFLAILLSTLLKNIYLVVALPWLFAFLLQFFLYIISKIKYAPLDLLGTYLLRKRYHMFEIAGVWATAAFVFVIFSFLIYTIKWKRSQV